MQRCEYEIYTLPSLRRMSKNGNSGKSTRRRSNALRQCKLAQESLRSIVLYSVHVRSTSICSYVAQVRTSIRNLRVSIATAEIKTQVSSNEDQ